MRYLLFVFSLAFLASCGDGVEGLTPEEYISQNNLEATELENGVYIVIKESGSDIKPTLTDGIHVSFVGTLTDGTVFEQADDFQQTMQNLIQGWFIGLKEIGIGGSCTLIIPHEMAFKDAIIDDIPQRSTVVFDIELKNIFPLRTVDEYIADNNLITKELEKGVHIVVHNEGNAKRPTATSGVVANYTGKLTNEWIFDQNQNAGFNLANVIEGWTIGLQEIGEGGSCTLVIPSEAAYGSTGKGSIPPNEPLVFDVEIVTVN